MASIWVVVCGESYQPVAFDTQAEADEFAADEEIEYVSGPWEIDTGEVLNDDPFDVAHVVLPVPESDLTPRQE